MNKEFVPYEESLALRELGFDEPCMYYVDEQNNSFIYNFQTHPDEFIEWCSVTVISTPLYQQAFRWFREKYNLYQFVHYHSRPEYTFAVYNDIEMNWTLHEKVSFNTYEEAELACLKKLIQIVKNNE
jgi:hypothetical protein